MQKNYSGFDLIKSTLTSGTAAGLAQVIMVIYALLAARLLKSDQYGVMAACYGATAITSFFFNWGLDSWLLKSASISKRPLQLAGRVIRIKFLTGLFWGIILFFVLPTISPGLYLRSILLLVIVDTLLDSVTNIFYITLLVEGRVAVASGLMVGTRILRILSVILLFIFVIDNLYWLVLFRMLITILAFIAGTIITKPNLIEIGFYSSRELAHEVSPFALSELLTLGYYQMDINLVSFFTGDKALVGNYAVVVSLLNAVTAIYVSINNVLLPVFTSAYQKRAKNFIKFVTLAFCGLAVLGGIIAIGFSFFGPKFIPILLGSQYIQAGLFLKTIAPLFFIKALSQTGAMFLVVIDRQKQRTYPQAIAVVIKAMAQIFTFNFWQIFGIIWAYIASELVMLIGFVPFTIQWYQREWRPQRGIRSLI